MKEQQEGVTAKGVLKVLLAFVCVGLAIFVITYYGSGIVTLGVSVTYQE